MPLFGFLNNADANSNADNQRISATPNTLSPEPQRRQGPIEAIDLEITVIQGSDLTAKDRAFFGLGKPTSSDPFVKVYLCQGQPPHASPVLRQKLKLGSTRTIYKTLHPYWNDTIVGSLRGSTALRNHSANHPATLEFHVLDEDQLSKSDLMGIVTLNIPIAPRNLDYTEWYEIPPDSAKRAQGRLQIRLQTTIRRSQILVPGATFCLGSHALLNDHHDREDDDRVIRDHHPTSIPTAVPTKLAKGQQIIQLGLSWDVITHTVEEPDDEASVVSQSSGDDFVTGFNSEHTKTTTTTTTTGVDLDASCVAISKDGHVIMPDTVYYGNLANTNRSVVHSGDEQEGAVDGDDESIIMHLDRIPDYVLCMYILLTVATPHMTLQDVESTEVRVRDMTPIGEDYSIQTTDKSFRQGQTLCTFTPSNHRNSGDATAMFMLRLARDPSSLHPKSTDHNTPNNRRHSASSKAWLLTPMEKTHPTARDFGSLLPQAKLYTRDLLPHIQVDPTERVAILRKGGNIRIQDYCHNHRMPDKVTFGLAWDMSDNAEFIDLDASAICLDANLNLIDMIWWKQLHSKDYNIVHHGDEREGDQAGDDELIDLYLNNMTMMGDHCNVHYIGFVINSYSGQKLNDVARASCHLFDEESNVEMATYAMTNAKQLEGVTALFVGCLYRAQHVSSSPNQQRQSGNRRTVPDKAAQEGEWCFAVISEASHGRTVKANVEQFRDYLKRNPLQPAPAAVVDDFGDASVAGSVSTTSYETSTSPSLVKEVTVAKTPPSLLRRW